MLPFLKPRRQEAGIAVIDRKPDEDSPKNEPTGLKAAASDLIKAVHDRDIESVENAIRAAFQILDAEPHVEGEHLEE